MKLPTIVYVEGLERELIDRFIKIAYDVAAWNGNRKDVSEHIAAVSNDYSMLVNSYALKPLSTRQLKSFYGCCFYSHYWEPNTRATVKYAIIYIRPGRPRLETIETLAHEVAHAISAGAHGYTWRRMYAMLLQIAAMIFNVQDQMRVADSIFMTVKRYAVRTHGSWTDNSYADEVFIDRMMKIETEVNKHIAASKRCARAFGSQL